MQAYKFGILLKNHKITNVTPYISKKYPNTFRIEMVKHHQFVDEAISLGEPEVIYAAIQNNLKPEMYDEWSKHPNAIVRRGLAEQGYFPETLIKDKNPKVRYGVVTKHPEYFPHLLKRKADYELAWHYLTNHSADRKSEPFNHMLNTTPPASVSGKYQLVLKLKTQKPTTKAYLLKKTMTAEQLFDMAMLETVKDLDLHNLLVLASAREIMKNQHVSGFQRVVDACLKGAKFSQFICEYEENGLNDQVKVLLERAGVLNTKN